VDSCFMFNKIVDFGAV